MWPTCRMPIKDCLIIDAACSGKINSSSKPGVFVTYRQWCWSTGLSCWLRNEGRRAISLVDVDIIPCVFFYLQRGKNRCSKTGVQRLLQITFSKPLTLSNEILELIFVPLPSKEKNLSQDWLISDNKGYLRAYRRNTQTGDKVDFFFLITGKKKKQTSYHRQSDGASCMRGEPEWCILSGIALM